jgi:hypothetical protein
MQNTIKCQSSKFIKHVFDLKGSMINRHVKITPKIKNTSTLKDLNLLEKKKEYQNENTDILKFKLKDIELIKY